jgi:hypothetical protein
VHVILSATEAPAGAGGGATGGTTGSSAASGLTHSCGSQEFVSGDGFGLPAPVPDMMVRSSQCCGVASAAVGISGPTRMHPAFAPPAYWLRACAACMHIACIHALS